MTFLFPHRPGAPSATAAARRDEHHGIRTIGRLVVLCAVGLVVAAVLLIGTALQVMRSLDDADLANERLRAANAIDAMVTIHGALTDEHVIALGKVAGLSNAHLSDRLETDSRLQQVPLLAEQGPSGSYLTWTRSDLAERTFRQFAPVRLPIIGGMLLLVLGVMLQLRRVVADIERQRQLAHRQSRSDVVTGLANRLAFETALDDLARTATPFAILILDLDRFKDINDAFGHAAGDEVLRTVGARLSRLLYPADLLARLGGDEFVLLCTSRPTRSALAALAQQCIAAIEQPIELEGRAMRVGVSLGIVPAGALGLPPSTLMGAADAALYRAKSVPGSTFRFAGDDASPTMVVPELLVTA
ncbi:GGDEF domain-containing protein [Devosia sp.]|uniref:GGDEF domain-containing protein n=1 Tax=Devosia sp. TaxID=1871048 RepID=UPI001A0510A5|nr:GGDEF domain-containing protein [Devosia sp.]MBE0578097.1 GGDEF domain-containing protein [Devosia sp.]